MAGGLPFWAILSLPLLGQEAKLSGGFWSAMASFNINTAGFVIVGSLS